MLQDSMEAALLFTHVEKLVQEIDDHPPPHVPLSVVFNTSHIEKKFNKATNKSCDWSEDATSCLLQNFEEKF
jgi:UDP:flavonoid glycosyltransferase YjiC (YdhE family)